MKLTLEDCLFKAFANATYCNPQEKRYIWAINEGLLRLGTYEWHATEARKQHRCVRGCTIKPMDTYYRYGFTSDWSDNFRVCASCLAMILYFRGVAEMPSSKEWLWDVEADELRKETPLNSEGIGRLLTKLREVHE